MNDITRFPQLQSTLTKLHDNRQFYQQATLNGEYTFRHPLEKGWLKIGIEVKLFCLNVFFYNEIIIAIK